MTDIKHWDTQELSDLLFQQPIEDNHGGRTWISQNEADNIADEIVREGFRKIFDGDCGLSSIKDPEDREAAEAWMRFSNLVMCDEDHNGIAAMKQMLHELGYRKVDR